MADKNLLQMPVPTRRQGLCGMMKFHIGSLAEMPALHKILYREIHQKDFFFHLHTARLRGIYRNTTSALGPQDRVGQLLASYYLS